MIRFKQARMIQVGDVIVARAENGDTQPSTVFMAIKSDKKEHKIQHTVSGNVAKGILVIFDDLTETLLHPEQQVEVHC